MQNVLGPIRLKSFNEFIFQKPFYDEVSVELKLLSEFHSYQAFVI